MRQCVYAYRSILLYKNNTGYKVLYKNNIGGVGLAVLCDVVGAATVYKIVKKDYIALQCKSLKLKEEINRDTDINNGDRISAHEVDYVAGLRRPIKPMESRTGGTLVLKKSNKVLDKSEKV